MSFSENLQFLRTRNSITQEQLAEQLDVSRQSVSKWESGASFPEMDTLLRICDLYSVDLDTLLRGSVEASQVSDTARYDDFMTCFIRRMTLAIGAIIAACVPVSATAARAKAATAVFPVPTSPRSRRFMTSPDAMSEKISRTATSCSSESSNGMAWRKAATCVPATSWHVGEMPLCEMCRLARSATCRQSSSS